MNKNKNRNNFDKLASSINKSSFSANILKRLNKASIPFDSNYYYSLISLSKKLPISKKNNLNRNNSNYSLLNNISRKSSDSFLLLNNNKNSVSSYNDINIKKKEKNQRVLNIKMQIMKQYLRKRKEKMNRTKFKFFRIVKNHGRKECSSFETKNQKFNEKLENYFNSDYYYNINKIYHNKFHFGKYNLNLGNDKTKQYISSIHPEQISKLNSDIVLRLLNDEDKKLIDSDPYFFFQENKKLYKLTKTKFRTLINRLNEEDAKLPKKENESEDDDLDFEKYYKDNKNKSADKIKKKSENTLKLKNNKKIKEEIPFLNEKCLNKIINKDLNERIKNIKSNINPIEKQMIKTEGKLNYCKRDDYLFKENKGFYKTFHIITRSKYFKYYSLERNRRRLIKEALFNQEIIKRKLEKNKDKDIIIRYQRQLEDSYSKINQNKRYKT